MIQVKPQGRTGSITARSLHACVVRPDEPLLILVVAFCLTKGEASLTSHTLGRPDLFDGFLESVTRQGTALRLDRIAHAQADVANSLFLSRTVVGQVELLDLLHDMV